MSKTIEYYSKFDEWGRLDREPLEFQINWAFHSEIYAANRPCAG